MVSLLGYSEESLRNLGNEALGAINGGLSAITQSSTIAGMIQVTSSLGLLCVGGRQLVDGISHVPDIFSVSTSQEGSKSSIKISLDTDALGSTVGGVLKATASTVIGAAIGAQGLACFKDSSIPALETVGKVANESLNSLCNRAGISDENCSSLPLALTSGLISSAYLLVTSMDGKWIEPIKGEDNDEKNIASYRINHHNIGKDLLRGAFATAAVAAGCLQAYNFLFE